MEAVQDEGSIIEDGRNDASLNFTLEIKVYKRRWLQLILLFILSISSAVHWYQFTIITSIIRRYYDVSSFAVESTFVMMMVTSITLVLPASYLMNRIGLRWTCLVTTLLTTLGSWIKVFSTSPNHFIVACVGQLVVAVSSVFIVALPGPMVASWFGPEETGLATTIIAVGPGAGNFASFLISSTIFTNLENIEYIGNDLSKMFWIVALGSTVVTVALFFLFQEQPDLPPSKARALVLNLHPKTNAKVFWHQAREILRNRDFIMFWNSNGLIAGVLTALFTFINSFYVAHFKDGETDVGVLALSFAVVGSVSAPMYGAILDRSKAFRAVPIISDCLTVVVYILFATTLMNNAKWMVFVTYSCLGFLGLGYICIAPELCVEITYPTPESTALGFLHLSNQVYGIVIVLFTGRIMEFFGDIAAHASLCACLTLGSLFMILNKFENRRHNAKLIAAEYRSVRCETSTSLHK